MRNGIVADALRKGGSPYRLIMGVNIPQLKDIAADTPHSTELARTLWNRTSSREAVLIAPMIMPREEMTQAMAEEWMMTVPDCEAADILCHSLLRHQEYAPDLAEQLLLNPETPAMVRYAALRLMFNLVGKSGRRFRSYAATEAAAGEPLTARIARVLVEEIDYCYPDQ